MQLFSNSIIHFKTFTILHALRLNSRLLLHHNDRVMRLPVKLVAESLGVASIKTGGRLSLGPPPGGIILAQPELVMIKITPIKMIKREKDAEMFIFITVAVHCKLNSNYLLPDCI